MKQQRVSIDYEGWLRIRAERPVFVYILTCDPFVKIGIAADILARITELQIGNPLPIELAHSSRAMTRREAKTRERIAHKRLGTFRVSGEWFHCTVEEAKAALRGGDQ